MCFWRFRARKTQPVSVFFSPGGHALHLAAEGTRETVWLSVHWLRLNKNYIINHLSWAWFCLFASLL